MPRLLTQRCGNDLQLKSTRQASPRFFALLSGWGRVVLLTRVPASPARRATEFPCGGYEGVPPGRHSFDSVKTLYCILSRSRRGGTVRTMAAMISWLVFAAGCIPATSVAPAADARVTVTGPRWRCPSLDCDDKTPWWQVSSEFGPCAPVLLPCTSPADHTPLHATAGSCTGALSDE